tara:strand:- start:19261 stop:19695 length:435 start_codon:yes stop_codon:yes gene_type:complete
MIKRINSLKILVMGLPGAGKTTLAEKLSKKLSAEWINADKVRKEFNDWDFSKEGRIRQAKRMRNLAKKATDSGKLVIADFVCPTPETRKDFGADLLIWIDTIKSGRFNDTNQMFIPPEQFFFRVTTKDAEYWVQEILKKLKDFK